MQIGLPRRTVSDGGRVRLACDLRFEGPSAKFFELYFEVPEEESGGFEPSAEGFLLAVLVIARFLGERRIKMEQPLCGDLHTNLHKWQGLQLSRFGDTLRPIAIESTAGITTKPLSTGQEAAMFLSGGVDSFSALQCNLDHYPPGDHRRITAAYFVYGLDIGDPNQPHRPDIFEETANRLRKALQPKGVRLITIYTNVRDIGYDWRMYEAQQFGSLLAAIAHFFSSRYSACTIALDFTIEHYPTTYGSDPWGNAYLSSSQLRIVSDGEQWSRLKKVRQLLAWPEVFSALRVCYTLADVPPMEINCGECRKCILTKLEMLVSGCLPTSRCFPTAQINADVLQRQNLSFPVLWQELIEPLNDMGETGLATRVQNQVRHCGERPPTEPNTPLPARIKRKLHRLLSKPHRDKNPLKGR